VSAHADISGRSSLAAAERQWRLADRSPTMAAVQSWQYQRAQWKKFRSADPAPRDTFWTCDRQFFREGKLLAGAKISAHAIDHELQFVCFATSCSPVHGSEFLGFRVHSLIAVPTYLHSDEQMNFVKITYTHFRMPLVTCAEGSWIDVAPNLWSRGVSYAHAQVHKSTSLMLAYGIPSLARSQVFREQCAYGITQPDINYHRAPLCSIALADCAGMW
jgi:hypothetical protein